MIINYEFEIGEYDTKEFEYEVSLRDVRFALREIIWRDYFKGFKGKEKEIKPVIDELIADRDLEDRFEEEIKEYFEEEAYECFKGERR